ncbi:hypothetical protein DAI21_22785 (plasmid) [Lelliottia sp. WB101]|nr:hypothetical protein DAI21_22785 [Lelliottia sp. WB101]
MDRFFYPSSKRYLWCGYIYKALPQGLEKWLCLECGADHDRDINAA